MWQALLVPFTQPLEALSFVSIDLETTGLVPGFDAITEIGAARFSLADGAVIGETFASSSIPAAYLAEGFGDHGDP